MNIVQEWKTDPRIQSIEWRDVSSLSKKEVLFEVLISLPWFVGIFLFLFLGLYPLAIISAFFFFLTGLRQVHAGYHGALGLSRFWTDWFLFIMSCLMLGSMHAVQYNHLRHHKHCMDEDDIEAKSAHMSWWQAILFGPIFPYMLHKAAWVSGSDYYRQWIGREMIANIFVIYVAVALLFAGIDALFFHVMFMMVGQCLTAFFAFWTVHHNCDTDKTEVFARTQRGFLKNFISYDMFYHVEHHLFPKVPQKNLKGIAERLDQAVPELTKKRVY